MAADKPLMGSMIYSVPTAAPPDREGIEIWRLTASDRFYKTMLYLACPRADQVVALRSELPSCRDATERKALVERIDRMASEGRRQYDIIRLLVLEELGVRETMRRLGIPKWNEREGVKAAFDCLSEALSQVSLRLKRASEKGDVRSSKSVIILPP